MTDIREALLASATTSNGDSSISPDLFASMVDVSHCVYA